MIHISAFCFNLKVKVKVKNFSDPWESCWNVGGARPRFAGREPWKSLSLAVALPTHPTPIPSRSMFNWIAMYASLYNTILLTYKPSSSIGL